MLPDNKISFSFAVHSLSRTVSHVLSEGRKLYEIIPIG